MKRYPRRRPDRTIMRYEPVQVVPLPPGWHNWYRDEAGELYAQPAPAMLLSEIRGHDECWDVPGRPALVREVSYSAPYETEASVAALDEAWVHRADDDANYLLTTGPGMVPKDAPENRDLPTVKPGYGIADDDT